MAVVPPPAICAHSPSDQPILIIITLEHAMSYDRTCPNCNGSGRIPMHPRAYLRDMFKKEDSFYDNDRCSLCRGTGLKPPLLKTTPGRH